MNCVQCEKPLVKPKKYSNKQWMDKKYCNFECWGKHKSLMMKGMTSPMKGKKHTVEAKEQNRLAHLGSKSSLWKGGISTDRKSYYSLKSLERYARLKGSIGSFTVKEWSELKEKYGHKCAICGISETIVKLTKDHITPLTKGGSNHIKNIQPLCQSCNSRKSNKTL